MKKTLYSFACIMIVCALPLFGAPTARPLTHIGTQIVSNPAASTALALETVFILGSKWIKDRDVAWWWMPMYGVDLVRAVVISRNIVGGLKR